MSIASEITRLQNAKAALKLSIEAKGVTVPSEDTLDDYPSLVDSIPTGGGEYEPICFTSLEDGNTFKLNKQISISVDGKQTWQTLYANTPSPAINAGEKIYFKATENASPFSGTPEDYYQFSTAKTCNVSGHPYSLYGKFSSYFFYSLFSNTKVVDASGLILEEVVSDRCYSSMFNGCTSLVTAPELPATNLAYQCYYQMFNGCTSLTTAPELPATTLAKNCYGRMFNGCTSLVTAPELLPATTLLDSCYETMFNGCTSLVTAPELPATTLRTYCYDYMFCGCSSLNYIKALFTTPPSASYTDSWVEGVASTGTFVKNSEATWTNTGNNAVPVDWTVETAS